MSWQEELDELRRREAMAYELGGPDKVARQRAGGKLTVRERVHTLLDEGSFHELGAIAGLAEYDDNQELIKLTPSNFVFGRGRLDGRRVVVQAIATTVYCDSNCRISSMALGASWTMTA